MRSTTIALGLLGLASQISAVALTTSNVSKLCKPYPTKLPKLFSCSTASQFCSSYIGSANILTKTKTITTTVSPPATTETAVYIITSSVFVATSTSVEAPTPPIVTVIARGGTSTVTSTTTAASCPSSNLAERDSAATSTARGASSCGIPKSASPALVSGACSCFLAPTSTVTKTLTTGVPSLTLVSTTLSDLYTYSTYTVTTDAPSTTTVTDIKTVYACTTGACVATAGVPTVVLASPTPLALGKNGNYDDEEFSIVLPFPVTIYGVTDTTMNVDVNGFVQLPGSTGSSYALVLSEDLFIVQGTNQGIWYEVDGQVGSRTLTIEWYTTDTDTQDEIYHFAATFQEQFPGQTRFTYYQISDDGANAVVGFYSTQDYHLYSEFLLDITPGLIVNYIPAPKDAFFSTTISNPC